MPKKTQITATDTDLLIETKNEKRPFNIRGASIKDDLCNYVFEVTSGICLGDIHKVNGTGIIKDDLRDALQKLNVHLAVIDEVFKAQGMDIEDIDTLHNDDTTLIYRVTAFKIKGNNDNESVALIGHKYVHSVGGRMEIKTPYIALDSLSPYKWYNELKSAVDNLREEVALYKEGKYTAVEEEEKEEDLRQLTIADNIDDDFENAKV